MTAMVNSPFPTASAEGSLCLMIRDWARERLRTLPWADLAPVGAVQRLALDAEVRIRRGQTGNDQAYAALLSWVDVWNLDFDRLADDQADAFLRALLTFPLSDAFWDRSFEIWVMHILARALEEFGWSRVLGPLPLHQRSGVIYEFEVGDGGRMQLRFQRREPLPQGRWSYRDGAPLGGVPDITLSRSDTKYVPLVIDAKNRWVPNDRYFSRSEETYKMLGYAENFAPCVTPGRRFNGVLVLPAEESKHRVLEGPNGERLDLIAVSIESDRTLALSAFRDAVSGWANQAG